MTLDLKPIPGGVSIPIKVVPGASRTRAMGLWSGRLKVAVAAPPERGRANQALIEFLAGRLGVRKSLIALEEGETSPLKRVRVSGLSLDQVREALGSP